MKLPTFMVTQIIVVAILLIFVPAVGEAGHVSVAAIDTVTVALWHFSEASGSMIADSSGYGNEGTAFGTSVVSGPRGNARYFNGTSDYIYVSNPANGSLGFAAEESFAIDAWFNTTSAAEMRILRKGLVPVPGYEILMSGGKVGALIGNQASGTPPDTLLPIVSTQTYNDGQWHYLKFVRDRISAKMFLYVDDVEAAAPVDDNFPIALQNSAPLTIGRWISNSLPMYFQGSLDEIRISKLKPVKPPKLNDSTIVGYWHLDELSGSSVMDSSVYANHGTAVGTAIVAGQVGNARQFNGSSDYVYVPYPTNGSLDFAPDQSFAIQAWFKSTSTKEMRIVRKGLAPVPGYEILMTGGKVGAIIGNREDGVPPDTLLVILSSQTYNDDQWHHVALVRDRQRETLFLYIDDLAAANPVEDHFPYALAYPIPLGIGVWYGSSMPLYFEGSIDEVEISRTAGHPPSAFPPNIEVTPKAINFGLTMVGDTAVRQLFVSNVGIHDTLVVTGVTSTNPAFSASATSFDVLPGATNVLQLLYSPASVHADTGTIVLTSNDPGKPAVGVIVQGRGFLPVREPLITGIKDIPNDQGKQVRVVWSRSVYDGIVDSLTAIEYSLWRRVDDLSAGASRGKHREGEMFKDGGHLKLYSNNVLWDFIVTVPAVQFAQYAYVAPTLFDSTRFGGMHWSVFEVSARLNNGDNLFSAPDSGYSIDNLSPNPPGHLAVSRVTDGLTLTWDQATDPDVSYFAVYRGPVQNFIPTEAAKIGAPRVNGFVDQNIGGSSTVFYRIAAVDKAGNEGSFSAAVGVSVTGLGGGDRLPATFKLYQSYPNPFNPSATIRYDVPDEALVTLKVYDVVGREVATLVNDRMRAGTYEAFWNAEGMSSGVYLVRMGAAEFHGVVKILLLK